MEFFQNTGDAAIGAVTVLGVDQALQSAGVIGATSNPLSFLTNNASWGHSLFNGGVHFLSETVIKNWVEPMISQSAVGRAIDRGQGLAPLISTLSIGLGHWATGSDVPMQETIVAYTEVNIGKTVGDMVAGN